MIVFEVLVIHFKKSKSTESDKFVLACCPNSEVEQTGLDTF